MKFLSIYLSNYIGIYNGMGLYDIHIDMTRCRNRITIIRGDNGSGKSTLSKAMNLFPDPSDAFIPGMAARKEIILQDGPTMYKLVFIHGIKSNGDRETTKAYITKTFNDTIVELNENGNVTSYKDILYSELGLDANFAALSQLSTDDRGLADKKPAERKRFVNSIISSLETYNNIYKVLSKRSASFKSLINSTASKLALLGDENAISSNLEAVEAKINNLNDKKDQAVIALAKEQSIISLLDPDGSIQNANTVISADLELAEADMSRIQSVINSLVERHKIKFTDILIEYRKITDRKNSLIIQNQIDRGSLDSFISQRATQIAEQEKKLHRLAQLNNGESYESILASLEDFRIKMKAIRDQLSVVGITDILSISKDEYILALETLKDLDSYISSFKSCTDYSIIESIVSEYLSTRKIPIPIDTSKLVISLEKTNADITSINSEIRDLESRIGLLDKLLLRPETCTDNTCAFIKDAVEFASTDPKSRLSKLYSDRNRLQDLSKSIDIEIAKALEFNESLNRFSIIAREVEKNKRILSKMPNGEMFKDTSIFFTRLLNGYGFEYMQSIYRYIDLANLFDTYRSIDSICKQYESELKIYETKAESIAMVNQEIDDINKAISTLTDKIDPINAEIADRMAEIAMLQDLEGVYSAIIDNMDKQKPLIEKIRACRTKLAENSQKMNRINAAIASSQTLKEQITQLTYTLEPLMKDRDKLIHSIQLMKEYRDELNELQANYDFIETIKYYSSPTTGIQLVFMELYMGKIISLANELLKLLFQGKFEIQPFVINESEFRIPCLGEGYLNDDISSMSSSQVCMISMILSFSLLHNSSTKYNIIKLDEIDGPLDYNNRLYFIDVLNSIMDIMNTEQCIMISHNSELQVDNSDVILLKHDENNMDYQRGNVIWSY